MKNEIKVFGNGDFKVRIQIDENGNYLFDTESVAHSLGFIEFKNGKEYIRWRTVNGYLQKYLSQDVAKGSFISESMVYKLAFKASNEVAENFQDWLACEVLPTLRKTGHYEVPYKNKSSKDRTHIMEMNARSRMAQTYLKLAQIDTLSSTYKTILTAKAAEVLSGEQLLPLPKSEKKVYSAAEIGKLFGISANKVGRLANQHNLKMPEYGEYRRDKSQHSAHECDTWVYFDTVIPVLSKLLNVEVA